jgi:hypothetical protein
MRVPPNQITRTRIGGFFGSARPIRPSGPVHALVLALTCGAAALLPLACADSSADSPPSGQAGSNAAGSQGGNASANLDPNVTQSDAVIGTLAAGYLENAKMNRASFRTASHLGNPQVNVFANERAEAAYRTISPGGEPPAGFVFPAGSLLVKEMLDADGGPPILTVMYKQPPGYDPPHDDWWYGRLRSDGTATDPAYVGRVGFCSACHQGTQEWDFAWGVPEENKTPAPRDVP